jgi:hypothetical protein
MFWIFRDAIDGTSFDALGFVVKAYAFSATFGINNIYLFAYRNGLVRAFW